MTTKELYERATANGAPLAGWKPGTDTITDIRPGNLRDRAYEEKQRHPYDMEAQEGQRAIAIHALENLATSDRGVVLLRRALRRALDPRKRPCATITAGPWR